MSQANVTPVAGELHSLFCMAGSKFLYTEITLYNPYLSEAHYLNQEITVFLANFLLIGRPSQRMSRWADQTELCS